VEAAGLLLPLLPCGCLSGSYPTLTRIRTRLCLFVQAFGVLVSSDVPQPEGLSTVVCVYVCTVVAIIALFTYMINRYRSLLPCTKEVRFASLFSHRPA
jgi:hypothetical protein